MGPKKIFKWSSHTPVIQSALDLVQPRFVLELGIGNFSTPHFLASAAERILHIENDQQWLEHVQHTFTDTDHSEFRLHWLGDHVNKSTGWNRLVIDQQTECLTYYQDLAQEIHGLNLKSRLLFVDHFTCLRALAINCLGDEFDCIIYHDAETPEVYGYETIRADFADQFDHYMLHTRSSWTGCLIRKNSVTTDDLTTNMLDHAETFGQRFDVPRENFCVDRVW